MSSFSQAPNTRRGYLNEDFRFFHLKDDCGAAFEDHYHDFCKLIVFVAGKVTYLIEGQAYPLQPWDLLLVTGRELHQAQIQTGETYERYIVWVKPAYLQAHSTPESQLLSCFESASAQQRCLIRPQPDQAVEIQQLLAKLENVRREKAFGEIAHKAFFLLLMVNLNRLYGQSGPLLPADGAIKVDPTVSRVLEYINRNLAARLSVAEVARQFYLSPYSLMHRFKQQTGYSVHRYILQKRLIAANELIKQGCPYMEAGNRCGFADYSSFVRAFRKYFGASPRKYYRA
ncbi:MAG TPA: AraC family transcriptional regulator [Bacillota bacterium]|nr:AraC family transcriptional regulator [Bacillota bacterium]